MADENNNIEELLGDEENLNKAIAIIKGKNFVVKPTEDYNKLDETIRKEIGTHFGKDLSAIDNALSEHLGIDKEGNEKTADFIKRVVPGLKNELDTLKSERDKGVTGGESLKAEVETLLTKLKESDKEKEELKATFETTLVNKDKEFLVNKALSKLTFKEGIDTILTPAKQQFIESVLSTSTLEEGKLVFKDEQGVVKRNDKNDSLTVLEMATKQFESVLNTTIIKEGIGGSTDNNKKSSFESFVASRKPSTFEDAEATVKAYYNQLGERVVNGSKKYADGIKYIRGKYNI